MGWSAFLHPHRETLPVKTTEIVIEFKNVPDNVLFARRHDLAPNLLVIRVNPMEGIYIKINAKKPGEDNVVQPVSMEFCQSCLIGINTPEAYERLIHDAVRGDSTYFTRWDEVALHGHTWIRLRKHGVRIIPAFTFIRQDHGDQNGRGDYC